MGKLESQSESDDLVLHVENLEREHQILIRRSIPLFQAPADTDDGQRESVHRFLSETEIEGQGDGPVETEGYDDSPWLEAEYVYPDFSLFARGNNDRTFIKINATNIKKILEDAFPCRGIVFYLEYSAVRESLFKDIRKLTKMVQDLLSFFQKNVLIFLN